MLSVEQVKDALRANDTIIADHATIARAAVELYQETWVEADRDHDELVDAREAIAEATAILKGVRFNRDPREGYRRHVSDDTRFAAESWVARWEPVTDAQVRGLES